MDYGSDFFTLPSTATKEFDYTDVFHQNLPPGALLENDDVIQQFLSSNDPIEEPDLNGPTTLHCEICQKQFSNAKKYYGHLRVHSKSDAWVCDTCPDQKFSTKQLLMKHSLIHKPLEKIWKCPQCPMVFEVLFRLQQHLFTKHLNHKPHKCDVCNKEFSKPSDLKTHIASHDERKRIPCKECNRKFASVSNLNRHMLKHSNIKPHRCTGCGKHFQQLASLNRHKKRCKNPVIQPVMSQSGPSRVNYCRVCGMGFQYKTALVEHCARQHSDGKAPVPTSITTKVDDKIQHVNENKVMDNIVDDILSVEDDYIKRIAASENNINQFIHNKTDNFINIEKNNVMQGDKSQNLIHIEKTENYIHIGNLIQINKPENIMHMNNVGNHIHTDKVENIIQSKADNLLHVDQIGNVIYIDQIGNLIQIAEPGKVIDPENKVDNYINVSKDENTIEINKTNNMIQMDQIGSLIQIDKIVNPIQIDNPETTINMNDGNHIPIQNNENTLHIDDSGNIIHIDIDIDKREELERIEKAVSTFINKPENIIYINENTSIDDTENILHIDEAGNIIHIDNKGNKSENAIYSNKIEENILSTDNTENILHIDDAGNIIQIKRTDSTINSNKTEDIMHQEKDNAKQIDKQEFDINKKNNHSIDNSTNILHVDEIGNLIQIKKSENIIHTNRQENTLTDNLVHIDKINNHIYIDKPENIMQLSKPGNLIQKDKPESEMNLENSMDKPENLMHIDINQIPFDEDFYNNIDLDAFQTQISPGDYHDREMQFDLDSNRSMDQELMNALYQVKSGHLPDDLLNVSDLPNDDLPNDDLPDDDLPHDDLPNVDLPNDDLPHDDLPIANLPNADLLDHTINGCTIFETDVDLESSTNLAANLNQLIGENSVHYISTEDDDMFIISLNSGIDPEKLTDILNGTDLAETICNQYDVNQYYNEDKQENNEKTELSEKCDNNTEKNEVKVESKEEQPEVKKEKKKTFNRKIYMYVCRTCNKLILKKDNYMSHIATHDPTLRKHKCKVCKKRFSYKSTLNKHMRAMHLPVVYGAHTCHICDKQFNASWILKEHIERDHDRLTPHICDWQGCTKKFFKKSDLTDHKRTHTKERLFVCSKCSRSFTVKSNLYRHEKIHVRKKQLGIKDKMLKKKKKTKRIQKEDKTEPDWIIQEQPVLISNKNERSLLKSSYLPQTLKSSTNRQVNKKKQS